MRPLKYSINITVDGCADHMAGIPDEELHHYSAKIIEQADALIFGRVIYQMMESAWREPAETGEKAEWMDEWMMPFARTIHAAKKYVVSDSLKSVDWNAELIRGKDLEKTVRELKEKSGKGLYTAGLKLPLALAEMGLIDDYEFIVHPRIAGRGPAVFAGLSKFIDLKLTGRFEMKSGSVALRYTRK